MIFRGAFPSPFNKTQKESWISALISKQQAENCPDHITGININMYIILNANMITH